MGLDIVFNSFESFEVSRLCLLYDVGGKFIIILITMECNGCGAELCGAMKTFDEVHLSVDSVIVSMVRRNIFAMANWAADVVIVVILESLVVWIIDGVVALTVDSVEGGVDK